jgi:hypothetical protein
MQICYLCHFLKRRLAQIPYDTKSRYNSVVCCHVVQNTKESDKQKVIMVNQKPKIWFKIRWQWCIQEVNLYWVELFNNQLLPYLLEYHSVLGWIVYVKVINAREGNSKQYFQDLRMTSLPFKSASNPIMWVAIHLQFR